jgi:hypothetical protein
LRESLAATRTWDPNDLLVLNLGEREDALAG